MSGGMNMGAELCLIGFAFLAVFVALYFVYLAGMRQIELEHQKAKAKINADYVQAVNEAHEQIFAHWRIIADDAALGESVRGLISGEDNN